MYELIRLTFRLNYGLLGACVALNTEYIFQALKWEVVSNHLWVWQSCTSWQIFPLTLLSTKGLQLCSCFVLLYRIVYRTTSACTSQLQLAGRPPWATWVYADVSSWPSQWARRGLPQPLWLFTAKSASQNSGENSSSSINKDNAGRRQVIVFYTRKHSKGIKGRKHMLLSCFHYMQP